MFGFLADSCDQAGDLGDEGDKKKLSMTPECVRNHRHQTSELHCGYGIDIKEMTLYHRFTVSC